MGLTTWSSANEVSPHKPVRCFNIIYFVHVSVYEYIYIMCILSYIIHSRVADRAQIIPTKTAVKQSQSPHGRLPTNIISRISPLCGLLFCCTSNEVNKYMLSFIVKYVHYDYATDYYFRHINVERIFRHWSIIRIIRGFTTKR